MLESESVSHQGLVRKKNEDSFSNNLGAGLWVVADGVGGNGNGDVASQLAVQSVERKIRQGTDLVQAISEANTALVEAVENDECLMGMATTLVACQFSKGNRFKVAWVGDSRAYRLNQTGIAQITVDHNQANKLFSLGLIAEGEVQTHAGQHELTQALGVMTLDQIPVSQGALEDTDYLLLCTDGLTGVISDQEIYQTIINADSLSKACECLLARVLAEGAPDNVTFSIIQYQEGGASAKMAAQASYRLPFDAKPYLQHLNSRPMLLLLMLLSMIIVFLFI